MPYLSHFPLSRTLLSFISFLFNWAWVKENKKEMARELVRERERGIRK